MNGISALIKKPQGTFASSATQGHSEKTTSSMNQEEGPHQTGNLSAQCSWTAKPAEL